MRGSCFPRFPCSSRALSPWFFTWKQVYKTWAWSLLDDSVAYRFRWRLIRFIRIIAKAPKFIPIDWDDRSSWGGDRTGKNSEKSKIGSKKGLNRSVRSRIAVFYHWRENIESFKLTNAQIRITVSWALVKMKVSGWTRRSLVGILILLGFGLICLYFLQTIMNAHPINERAIFFVKRDLVHIFFLLTKSFIDKAPIFPVVDSMWTKVLSSLEFGIYDGVT